MMRPGRSFYKSPSVITATVVLLIAVLTVPTTIVLTARAENKPPTESAKSIYGKAINLGPRVNSSSGEYDPCISADGLELYFNSLRPGGLEPSDSDIWVTTRKTKADSWSEPVNLGPTVNSPGSEQSPSISGNGLSLYFSATGRDGVSNNDVWVTERKTVSDSWGTPVNLGPPVNSPGYEVNPEISRDGSTLYFASGRSGGSGHVDLWQVSVREHETEK